MVVSARDEAEAMTARQKLATFNVEGEAKARFTPLVYGPEGEFSNNKLIKFENYFF
jgi:hypothetical protein